MDKHDSHVVKAWRHYLAKRILKQRKEIRKTPLEQRRRDEWIGWYDSTMRAEHWLALPVVQPLDAAMVLCQFNPDESKIDWTVTTNDQTNPQDHAELLRNLQAADAVDPKKRTLRQWWDLAIDRGWKHHSWIDQYIEYKDLQTESTGSTSQSINQANTRVWTPERRAALQDSRNAIGIKATASKYKMSVARVKQLTVTKTAKQKAITLMSAWHRKN